jgi:ATP synthase protein I
MADPDPPPKDDALSSLRGQVSAAQAKHAPPSSAPPDSAAGLAIRFGGEFGAAILVGALVGYGVDALAHTGPWGLVVGLVLGFAAGVVNVVRVAQGYARAHPPDPNAPRVADDEED